MAETVKLDFLAVFKENVARYLDALHRGDAEGMAALFTEDGIYLTTETVLQGRQEIAAFYRSMMQERGMTDAKFSEPQITDKGEWVVVYVVFQNYDKDGQLKIISPCLMQVVPVGDTMLIKRLAGF